MCIRDSRHIAWVKTSKRFTVCKIILDYFWIETVKEYKSNGSLIRSKTCLLYTSGSFADRDAEVVMHQPVQPFQTPEQDAFQLGAHLLHKEGAVSYTHLDVYKRQGGSSECLI